VAFAIKELGEDARLNDLVRVALKRATGDAGYGGKVESWTPDQSGVTAILETGAVCQMFVTLNLFQGPGCGLPCARGGKPRPTARSRHSGLAA
jgi:hypothetical protein